MTKVRSPTIPIAVAVALAIGACTPDGGGPEDDGRGVERERPQITEPVLAPPSPGFGAIQTELRCEGGLGGVSCETPGGEATRTIIGGQGTNLWLTSSNPAHVPAIDMDEDGWEGQLRANVTIQNLMRYTMLAPIDVFFFTDPLVTAGAGGDTIEHCPADCGLETCPAPEYGFFDSSQRAYYSYDETLMRGDVSAELTWCFDIETADHHSFHYSFSVLVSAELDPEMDGFDPVEQESRRYEEEGWFVYVHEGVNAPGDVLRLVLYSYGEELQPGTYHVEDDTNLAECEVCILIYLFDEEGEIERRFFANSHGTVTVTQAGGIGDVYAGDISDASLVEWDVDADAPLGGGDVWDVEEYSWSTVLAAE